jgi:hypothetical protein
MRTEIPRIEGKRKFAQAYCEKRDISMRMIPNLERPAAGYNDQGRAHVLLRVPSAENLDVWEMESHHEIKHLHPKLKFTYTALKLKDRKDYKKIEMFVLNILADNACEWVDNTVYPGQDRIILKGRRQLMLDHPDLIMERGHIGISALFEYDIMDREEWQGTMPAVDIPEGTRPYLHRFHEIDMWDRLRGIVEGTQDDITKAKEFLALGEEICEAILTPLTEEESSEGDDDSDGSDGGSRGKRSRSRSGVAGDGDTDDSDDDTGDSDSDSGGDMDDSGEPDDSDDEEDSVTGGDEDEDEEEEDVSSGRHEDEEDEEDDDSDSEDDAEEEGAGGEGPGDIDDAMPGYANPMEDAIKTDFEHPPTESWDYDTYIPHLENEVVERFRRPRRDLEQRISEIVDNSTVTKQIKRYLKIVSKETYRYGMTRGRIHGKNIHRLYAAPSDNPRVFKKKDQPQLNSDTAIEFLIDCSGSMSGVKYQTSCACAVASSQTLSDLRIPHEIIGFSEGSYGLVSYVFKDFRENITRQKLIERMASQTVHLNQNADGESLLYAAERLLGRKEKNKVLIVQSDGMPAGYFMGDGNAYLKTVADKIERSGLIDLCAIGIMTDAPSRFYRNHELIEDISELDRVLMTILKRNLTGGAK